jgi:predicted RNase H-like HicB family nuclease
VASGKGYITLTLEAYKEGRAFVSRCIELDVASCGDTSEEALSAAREATTDYLNAIEQLGERKRIFAEAGIVIHKTKPRVSSKAVASTRTNGVAQQLVLPLPAAA